MFMARGEACPFHRADLRRLAQIKRQASHLNHTLPYQLLADVVLSVHFAMVLFVVGGLAFIVVGAFRGWRLVRQFWFRLAHLAAISVVVAQAWLGAVCPLTALEMWLRTKAQTTAYSGSFIEHWLQRVLYYEAPPWLFTLAYSLFGLLVLATWWFVPPSSAASPGAGREEA